MNFKSENESDMYTTEELVRHLSVQSGTLQRYIDIRRIKPDVVIKNPDKTETCYFRKERVKELCKRFGWTEISNSNITDMFYDYCYKMAMTMSYKPVFLISFLACMNNEGIAELNEIVKCFKSYYDDRINNGLPPEKKNCIFFRKAVSEEDVKNLIIRMPFKRFYDMGFMSYSSTEDVLQLNRILLNDLDNRKISEIVNFCDKVLIDYWKK